MPKTFSYGFLMGCSSVLLAAGAVGAAYGMRSLFLTEARPPVNAGSPSTIEVKEPQDPKK